MTLDTLMKSANYATACVGKWHLGFGRVTEKGIKWMEQAVARKQPFFLYLALSSPHRPFAPAPRFRGTSAMGIRGDVIHELDGRMGQVLAALERLRVGENTLLVFASDNGGERGANRGLAVNGPLRGVKTEVYEGGHRVPFIVRWPGHVKAGSESTHLVALTDLMATFAEITERSLPHDAAEDRFSFFAELIGARDAQDARPYVVTASMPGMLAIQEGRWKLIAG